MEKTYQYVGTITIGSENLVITKKNNMLYAGGIYNAGFAPYYEREIDDMFSLDENLQDFYEQLEQENNLE